MKRILRFSLLYLLMLGCIEPYEFVVEDKEPRLVVEGFISDKSYNETLLYPSNGRYFTVKLSYTSDVTNEWGQNVSGASVQLIDNHGNQISYVNIGDGSYSILDPDFKAEEGREYKLKITLSADEIYESSWESLPSIVQGEMGEIGFDELEKLVYKYQSGEKVVENVSGINVTIQVPEQNADEPIYYKWNFTPHWIFVAPLPTPQSPVKKCWVESPYYLSNYTLQEDYIGGGYRKNLFFMETFKNERIFEDFSVLVKQEVLSKNYYFFLKEMQEQSQGALLSDKPPYNLETNFQALNNAKKVIGYFSITSENAKRWYFNRFDLSYSVENKLRESCMGTPPFVPPPGCHSCLDYQNGEPSTIKPSWWRD